VSRDPVKHQVALWAGAAAFFGSLLTISIVDVALVTAGAVYSRERLQDAKRERESE
jgi:hypothetical protein